MILCFRAPYRGREIIGYVDFHIQPISYYREVFFRDLSLCCLVPFPLPRLYTFLTKFTSRYTFWNFLVAFHDVRIRRCLLCECVG